MSSRNPILIKYIPHGINEDYIFPLSKTNNELINFKRDLFKGKSYDFVILFNSRNISRKRPADVLLAYKEFCDGYLDTQREKMCLVMHTNPLDKNGANLLTVYNDLLGPKYNVIFSTKRLNYREMNFLYNSIDVTCLISSQEGFGLSIAESMMAGKMVIGNYTGGIKDQLCSEKENCVWSVALYTKYQSLLGSQTTPYIFDDRVSIEDVSNAFSRVYYLKQLEQTEGFGMKGREFILSDESMMSAKNMCKNFIVGFKELFDNWEPIKNYTIFKT